MGVTEPPSVPLSFSNNFWGKDDAGVAPLLERMHNAKVTSDELKSFYCARAAIEEEYARKLLNLSRKPLGSSEAGTLRMSLDVIRGEVEAMGKAHQSIAAQMKTELEEPLQAFAGGLKERRKIVQSGIEKLLKIKMQQTSTVNKARDRFEQDCLKIKGYLAQGHMVMGQEERRNKAKLEKTQIQLSNTSNEYEAAVKVLEETTGRWNRDWKAACDKFQDLEEERIDFTKSSLWSFANIASTVCVSDDASCEKVRLSLEDCEVEKDIFGFIRDSGTGQEIPDPPKFIDFCRGDAEDVASEADSESNYSVAQFPRAINPTFRTCPSPQPSTFESHNDPESELAKAMGLKSSVGSAHQPPLMPDTVPTAMRQQMQQPPRSQSRQQQRYSQEMQQPPRSQSRQQQGYPQEMYGYPPPQQHSMAPSQDTTPTRPRLQEQRLPPSLQQVYQYPTPQGYQPAPPQPQQAYQNPHVQAYQHPSAEQIGEIPQVPHNPYPQDGMTQFTRFAPPSDRGSSVGSPVRPSSRDSHSDYSNPTSMSSIEPPAQSGAQSPIKQMAAAIEAKEAAAPSPSKEKKGFWGGNSPFRRKSRHEKDIVQAAPALSPTKGRNTWAPARTSPTRGTILPGKQNLPSPSPEPVDPRANFQLNIGNNVFDVASPDARPSPKKTDPEPEEDPIAAALAELKGVAGLGGKQGQDRTSVDRYHGLATPAPPASNPPAPALAPAPTPSALSPRPMPAQPAAIPAALTPAQKPPPPSYVQPVSRLGAPKPAHTAKAMQATTKKYVEQNRDVFGSPARAQPTQSRPPTRGNEAPRAPSPQPQRAPSPAPIRAPSPQPPPVQPVQQPLQAQRPPSQLADYSQSMAIVRPRNNSTFNNSYNGSTSPIKPLNTDGQNRNSYNAYSRSRENSPNVPRAPSRVGAASPQPAQPQSTFCTSQQGQARPTAPPAQPSFRSSQQGQPAPSAAPSAAPSGQPAFRRSQTGPAPAVAPLQPSPQPAQHQAPVREQPKPTPVFSRPVQPPAQKPAPLRTEPRQQARPTPAAQPAPLRPESRQQPRQAPVQQRPGTSAGQRPGTSAGQRPPTRQEQFAGSASPQPSYNARPAFNSQPSYTSDAEPAPLRSASPNPQFRGQAAQSRPSSSRGSDMAGSVQLAPEPSDTASQWGGSARGRSGTTTQRPQSSYYASDPMAGAGAPSGPGTGDSRVRSKSVVMAPRQGDYTNDGKPILHYARAMYMYQAAIPEELTFAKGDILAITRLQDDGWYEAEVVSRPGKCGLAPSNYLINC